MALKSTKKIDIDFYNQKYILINAKQNDKYSRFLEATCYNRGELFSLNPSNHSAYIRYRKADEYGVFNSCKINYDGTIVIEFTEQMLAVAGMCYADLVIVDNGYAEVNPDTGEIIGIEDTAILSTMIFCIDVVETAIENLEIESTYEFDNLNKILEKATADFNNVILAAKSWAVGDTDIEGRIDIEDTDNAKYYASQAKSSLTNANTSATNAATSEKNAKTYADSAKEYLDNMNRIVDGLESGFIPMGTISFSELATVDKFTGYVYNISDNFTTDDTFMEGEGKLYTAGTNVYYTANDKWDCFAGHNDVATVDEVKAELGI